MTVSHWDCWIGAGEIVLPGITIGDNAVVGAGRVVTKDLPSDVVAVGNPCKVLREVNGHGSLDGRGQPVENGTGWRHSVLFYCLKIAFLTLHEIADTCRRKAEGYRSAVKGLSSLGGKRQVL